MNHFTSAFKGPIRWAFQKKYGFRKQTVLQSCDPSWLRVWTERGSFSYES